MAPTLSIHSTPTAARSSGKVFASRLSATFNNALCCVLSLLLLAVVATSSRATVTTFAEAQVPTQDPPFTGEGPYSGIPLPFIPAFRGLNMRRFVISRNGDNVIRLTTALSRNPATGQPVPRMVNYGIAVTMTTPNIDYITVNGRPVTNWVNLARDVVLLNATTGAFRNTPSMLPTAAAFTGSPFNPFISCDAIVTGQLFVNEMVAAGEYFDIRVEFGRNASTPSRCPVSEKYTILASGYIYTDQVPLFVQQYSYVFPVPVQNDTAYAEADPNALVSQFRAQHVNPMFGPFIPFKPIKTVGNRAIAIYGDPTRPQALFGPPFGPPFRMQYVAMMQPLDAWFWEAHNDHLLVGPTTATTAAHCTIGNVYAYAGVFVPAAILVSASTMLCGAFPTIDEAQSACDKRMNCIGYTTRRVPIPQAGLNLVSGEYNLWKEVPMCLVVPLGMPTSTPDFPINFDRMIYYKPTLTDYPKCKFIVERSGTIAISFQQTGMATSHATIAMNGDNVGICGETWPFIHGLPGSDGMCGAYVTCLVTNVTAGARIEVAMKSVGSNSFNGIPQFGCENGLGVLLEQIAVDAVQRFDPPLPTYSVAHMAGRRLFDTNLGVVKIQKKVFVYKAKEVTANIFQTIHDCDIRKRFEPNYRCLDSVWSIAPANAMIPLPQHQTCGGEMGFLGGQRGKSDQCETAKLCDSMMQFPANTANGLGDGYTGMISATFLTANTFVDAGTCTVAMFDMLAVNDASNMTLPPWVADPNSAGVRIPVFPMLSTIDPSNLAQMHLVTENPALTVQQLVRLLGTVSEDHLFQYVSVKPFFQFLDKGVPNYAHYVNWPGIFAGFPITRAGAYISPNSTYATFIDAIPTPRIISQVDIPTGTTRVRVSIAQIDAAASVTVMLGTATYAMEVVCGAGAKYGFKEALHGQCDVFYECADMEFTPADFQPQNGLYGRITVVVTPRAERSACPFEAAWKVTFADESAVPFNGCAVDEFQCPRERRCIKMSSICDRVQDCFSGEDEKRCAGWTELPNEGFCVDGGGAVPGLVNRIPSLTFDECRQIAIASGTTAFAMVNEPIPSASTPSGNMSVCWVYRGDVAANILANPSPAVCPIAGSAYLALSVAPAAFPLCRASIQCNANGAATLHPAYGCVCECFAGFYGADCAAQVSLKTSAVVVATPYYVSGAELESALTLGESTVRVACAGSLYGLTSVQPHYAGLLDKRLYASDCTVTSRRGLSADAENHYRLLHSPESFAAVAATLAPRANGLEPLKLLTFRTTIAQMVQLGGCVPLVNRFITGAACTIEKSFDRLRLVFTSNRIVERAVLKITTTRPKTVAAGERGGFAAAADSTTTTDVQFYNCTGSMEIDSAALCVVSACEIDLSIHGISAAGVGGSGGATVTMDVAVDEVFMDYASMLDCLNENVYMYGFSAAGNTETATAVAVENDPKSFEGFLIGGIIVLIIGALVCSAIAAYLWYRFIASRNATVNLIDYDALSSELLKVKGRLLAYVAYEKSVLASADKSHLDRRSLVAALIGVICVIGAIALMIVWGTGVGQSSNFRVLYEEYSDDHCVDSVAGYMPTRVFAVPDGEYDCRQVLSTGEAVGITYAAGECSGSDGAYEVRFRMASSKATCQSDEDSKDFIARSGACVPLSAIVPTTDRDVYVRLSCSTSDLVEKRFAALRQLTTTADRFVQTAVSSAPADLLLSSATGYMRSYSDVPTYPLRVFSGGVVSEVASTGYMVLDSHTHNTMDPRALAMNNFDPRRLVIQNGHCVRILDDSATANVNEAVACDDAAVSMQSVFNQLIAGQSLDAIPEVSRLAPSVLDAPLGFIFNNFGSPLATTWESAGNLAHKYYGAKGTIFDIGAHFPKSIEDPADDEGYTVSLYLRADRTTQGFAYAVCDAFEDVFDGTVHPLHRLGEIIANGQTGEAWYQSADEYRVYHSLYVNGPGRSITFAYASPTLPSGEKVQLLEFDLAQIGMERVLNGLWHHVALSFIVENGRVRMQLIVDGETSYTKTGWSVCVGDFSEPMTAFGDTAPVRSVVDDSVKRGGMVVTGYFNGGVYGLRAAAEQQVNTYFLQVGTQAMRDNNPFPRTSTLTLGIILIVAAALYLILLAVTGIIGVRGVVRGTRARNGKSVAVRYYNLFVRLRNAAVQRQQQQQHQSAGSFSSPTKKKRSIANSAALAASPSSIMDFDTAAPKDDLADSSPSPSPSAAASVLPAPIRVSTALRWLDLSIDELSIVLAELSAQTASAVTNEALLLMLLKVKTKEFDRTKFSVSEWNAVVAADAVEHAKRASRTLGKLFGTALTDEAAEGLIYDTTERDLFDIFGPIPSAKNTNTNKDDADGAADAADHTGAREVAELLEDGDGDTGVEHGVGMEADNTDHITSRFGKGDGGGAAGAGGLAAGTGAGGGVMVDTTIAADLPSIGGVPSFNFDFMGGLVEEFLKLVAPVVMACQAVFVWSTSITFPLNYDEHFRGLFSFISIDFAVTFDDIDTLTTPIIQFFAGVAVVVLVLYFLYADTIHFNKVLTEYVWRRDALEGGEDDDYDTTGRGKEGPSAPQTPAASPLGMDVSCVAVAGIPSPSASGKPRLAPPLPATLADALEPTTIPEDALLTVSTLPVAAARKIDVLLGKIKDKKTEDNKTENESDADEKEKLIATITVTTDHEEQINITKDATESKRNPNVYATVFGGADSDQTVAVVVVGAVVAAPNNNETAVIPIKSARSTTYEHVTCPSAAPMTGAADKPHDDDAGEANEDAAAAPSFIPSTLETEGAFANPTDVSAAPLATAVSTTILSDDDDNHNQEEMRVVPTTNAASPSPTTDNTFATVEKATVPAPPPQKAARFAPAAATTTQAPLEEVGVYCQRHPHQRLTSQLQTEIWPFHNPPSCCLTPNGDLCGQQSGMIYSCGLEYEDEATGELRVCSYALCEKHTRMGAVDSVLAMAFSFLRRIRTNGFAWFLSTMVVVAANAAYTPFMKTALMIVGCHPFYQCEFEHCWTKVDQKFALAAFGSIVIIVLLGAMYPIALFFIVTVRKRHMKATFLAPEYNGKYAAEGDASQISDAELNRFVSTDSSALAQQYQQLHYRWLFFPVMLIVYKIAQLIPAIFVEPRSFEQRLGCAIVQLASSLFMFTTSTQLSPVVLVSLRAAEVHNLLLLGLQNIALVVLNDSNTDVGIAMVITTIVYLGFSGVFFVITVLFPVIMKLYTKSRLRKFLMQCSLDFTADISLYKDPTVAATAAVTAGSAGQ